MVHVVGEFKNKYAINSLSVYSFRPDFVLRPDIECIKMVTESCIKSPSDAPPNFSDTTENQPNPRFSASSFRVFFIGFRNSNIGRFFSKGFPQPPSDKKK